MDEATNPRAANPAPSRATWPGFVAVDEGLDRLFRWDPSGDTLLWTTALATKCRTLQRISPSHIFGATDTGYFLAEIDSGSIVQRTDLTKAGVIAAHRLADGSTFLTGIDLADRVGVTFAEYDPANRVRRIATFPGDYVRGATLTPTDTILFTNDHRVVEGDWSGRILREFALPGFKHAWKSLRLDNGHTLISAGYGAFIAEFDAAARPIRQWSVGPEFAFVRPHFFGDFIRGDDGSLLVCNWLGHGPGLGGSGCALLDFAPDGAVRKVWQDAERTSSVQAFVTL